MSKYWFSEADTYEKVAELGSVIQCNDDFIRQEVENGNLECVTPEREYDEETSDYIEIFQYFFINKDLADVLIRHSDEIIFYDELTDCYIWGICHYGTSWAYVPFTWND